MELALNESADFVRESSDNEEEEKQLCDNCKKTNYDTATLAERFCIKCEEKLCPSCDKTHAEEGEHLVVALNEHKQSKKFKDSNFCVVHDEELAELYCSYCREVICSECLEESHSSHNCSRVEDVADFVSKQAEAEYQNLFGIQNHFEKERQKLVNEETEVIKMAKKMETEIQKRCDEITEFVYNESKLLLKELGKLRSERLEEIEMERKKMEEHAFTFEKFKEYCDQIKSNTNPRYTCEAEGVLRNIADDLKTRPEGRWKSRLFSVQFSIEKTDITQVLTTVGKLTIKCPCKMTESSAVQLRAKEVYGLTRLHDKLYVLSNPISIHRLQHPFTRMGEITTPEIKSPKYIVSCSKTSCLYIHDSGEECVWKVAIPSRRVSRWLSEVKEPCALSVTSNAELLMLRNNKPVCLEIYNEHAILVQRSRLPGTFPLLQRLCETPSGKFIGHGGQSVYIFTRNGSIISQFQPSNDPEYRGNPQCFHLSPYHIFLHCGSYSSYIGNFYKSYCGTISSLSLDLANHQILVDKSKSNGWKKPVTSCYLKESKQLLVLAEVVSGSDKTYSLRAYDVLPELGPPEICAKKLQILPTQKRLFCAPKPSILRAHCAK